MNEQTNHYREALESIANSTNCLGEDAEAMKEQAREALDNAPAAQPVAPEQAQNLKEKLADIIGNEVGSDHGFVDGIPAAAEAIVTYLASLASQQVKGYSVDEVRQAMMLMWADCGPNVKTVEAKQKASVILASLSAKGEAAHPSFDVIDKYGATHLIEKVPGTEVELSHLRHDQSVVSGDSKTFHYRLTKVDVDKGEAPKEKYGAVVRAEDGAPYDALAELIKRGIKLARLRADIKSDVEDAFYSQTVAIEIDGVRTTAVTHERFNRMLNVLYDRWLPRSTPAAPEGTVSAPVEDREGFYCMHCKVHVTEEEAKKRQYRHKCGRALYRPPTAPSGVVEALTEAKGFISYAVPFLRKNFPHTAATGTDCLAKIDAALSAVPKEGEQQVLTDEYIADISERLFPGKTEGEQSALEMAEALRDELDAMIECSNGDAFELARRTKSRVIEIVCALSPAATNEAQKQTTMFKTLTFLHKLEDAAKARYVSAHDMSTEQMVAHEDGEAIRRVVSLFGAFQLSSLTAEAKPNPEPLVAALHQYISLLHDELNDLVPIAHAHGWRSHRHEEGNMLREKIATLTQWEASQPSPDSPKN